MDKSELTSRDIENIGKWEQSFKKLNRKTYTVKEASAFIIGWHPRAYLNDHRKNQIQGLVKLITDSFGYDNWNGGTNTLMGEFSAKFGNEDAFSKEAYYEWACENLYPDVFDPENNEWFKTVKKVPNRWGNPSVIDFSDLLLKPLIRNSTSWNYWKNKNCYTTEELSFLALGIEPDDQAQYLEEQIYNDHILPLKQELDKKVDYRRPFEACTLWGVKEIDTGVVTDTLYFDKEVLFRICHAKKYPYVFAEDSENSLSSGLSLTANQNFSEDKLEVVDGLSLKDVRSMIQQNPTLGDILKAVNSWLKLDETARRKPLTLYSNLNHKAKKGGWGANNGELSEAQYQNIINFFIESGSKNRGKNLARKTAPFSQVKRALEDEKK